MKRTARLLNLYECIYGFAVAIVLVAAAFAVASVLFFPEIWFIAPLALAPLGLLALGVARRLREFRRYAHVPGPKPSFFLGSLRSLLLHEHGARDRALVELHQAYGPVVKVHMAWGGTPFVSLSVAPKELGHKDMDFEPGRRQDRAVAELDGPEAGREAHGASAADAAALCSEGRAAGGFPSGGGFRRAIFGPGDPARPGMAA